MTKPSLPLIFRMLDGKYIPYEGPTPLGEAEDYVPYLVRCGYRHFEKTGEQYGHSLEWAPFETDLVPEHVHEFAAIWATGVGARVIFVPNWPSLMQLFRDAAPVLQTQAVTTLVSMVKHLYVAYHGHEWFDRCPMGHNTYVE